MNFCFLKKFWILLIFLDLWMTPFAKAQFEGVLGTGNVAILSGGTSLDATVGFHYSLFDFLQLGATLNEQSKGYRSTSVTSTFIFFGPTLNLGSFEDAIFIGINGALRSGSADPEVTESPDDEESDPDPNGFGGALIAGKRFAIGGGFHFRPSISIVMVGQIGFLLYPLQFSIAF